MVCLLALYVALPSFLPQDIRQKYAGLLYGKSINLGLDLRGGSHLLLQADFNSYIREQFENLSEDVKLALRKESLGYRNFTIMGDDDYLLALSFTLRTRAKVADNVANADNAGDSNVNDDDLRAITKKMDAMLQDYTQDVAFVIEDLSSNLNSNLNLNSNGGGNSGASFKVKIFYKSEKLTKLRQSILAETIQTVRRRVDETGTREPIIQRKGLEQIILQVPGFDNPEMLKELLGKTAKLSFHLMNNSNPFPEARIPAKSGEKLMQDDDGRYYLIKTRSIITGDMLKSASMGRDDLNQPAVNFDFNMMGGRKFAEVTTNNIGKHFAIVLDGKVISAPVIRTAITGGSGQISGGFNATEANQLAMMLRAGALPAPIKILEERTVGASLGKDSIKRGSVASVIAIILVMVAMLYFYRIFGIFASISLLVNIALIIAILVILQATLTLPGIAGIVLTMGMAVDANVLIYERIKEEIGKISGATMAGANATKAGIVKATYDGFNNALKTILDSNITTLIATFLLFMFGYGPVKGFAVTLSVGILCSMFSALVFNRAIVFIYMAKKKALCF